MTTYKMIDIEGVGETYAKKLEEAGIKDSADLLKKAATRSGRAELEEATGISGKLILTWTNHADLCRINGVGPQYAELLVAAGVDTVKELAHRVPKNLAEKMAEVNAAKNLTNGAVSEKEDSAGRYDLLSRNFVWDLKKRPGPSGSGRFFCSEAFYRQNDQKAATTAPFRFLSMYSFTSGDCRAFTSFWISGRFSSPWRTTR